MLAVIVVLLRRDGDIDLDDTKAAVVVSMSAASIDRHLACERAKLMLRGRSHTKPATLLKSQIPIRTWSQWDEDLPGFVGDRPRRRRGWQLIWGVLFHRCRH